MGNEGDNQPTDELRERRNTAVYHKAGISRYHRSAAPAERKRGIAAFGFCSVFALDNWA